MEEANIDYSETKSIEVVKDGHPKHFIILVRHGERSDDPEREVQSENDSKDPDVKFDWHLTDKGSQQAFLTGKFIQENVIGQNKLKILPSDIKIFSSPFLRWIQTASAIANGLDSKIPNITIDDRLSEFLLKSWFDGVDRPLNHLTINHVKNSTFQKKYLGEEDKVKLTRFYGKDATPTEDDINIEEEESGICQMESNTWIRYPETYSDMFYRYSGFLNNIIYQEFFENAEELNARSKIIILVSHGFCTEPFLEWFSPDHAPWVSVDYWATSIAEKLSNEEKFDLVMKGDGQHWGLNAAVF